MDLQYLFQKFKNWVNFVIGRKIEIKGNFNTFQSALENSSGYDDDAIIKKKIHSFNKVINGEAVYEQDTKLFFKEKYDYDLIKYLEDIQKNKKESLCILDFGGSFGTLYFKNFKKFRYSYDWNIIEQEKIVSHINENSYKIKINFFKNLGDFKKSPDVVIFSGSIQYLSNPFEIINNLINRNIKNFLFLRTSFHFKNNDIFCIQKVPKNIYKSSYPITIFSYKKFTNLFKSNNFEINEFSKKIYIDEVVHLNLSFSKN